MSEQPQQEPQQKFNISGDASLENVQIGGIAGHNLNVNQIRGQVVYATIYDRFHAPDGLSQQSMGTTKSLTREEYRYRKVLLDKVKNFWAKGVLENSLHSKVLIELGLEKQPSAVQPSFTGVEEFPNNYREELPKGTKAIDVFEEIGTGRTLLILGEPGSGKTITLLKLAQSLIARTESNLSLPIPVVFNLSSWASKRQTIEKWLTQQLYDSYEVSKSLSKTWIEEQQLILLLDGLDEVKAEYRNHCIRELNQFIHSHGVTEMVVCCRIKDYEALEEKLNLQSAIYIQALTQSQIYQYLEQAGEGLLALKKLLQQDSELLDFATSPLILSVMSLAYQNCSLEELPTKGLLEQRYTRIFDDYIERMFQRRQSSQQYPEHQAKYWLIWLAKNMFKESQTIFFIEQLQPFCLQLRRQYISYKLKVFFISGLIGGLVIGLISGLFIIYVSITFSVTAHVFLPFIEEKIMLILLPSLFIFIFTGVIGGVLSGVIGVWGKLDIKTVETLKLSYESALQALENKFLLTILIVNIIIVILYFVFLIMM